MSSKATQEESSSQALQQHTPAPKQPERPDHWVVRIERETKEEPLEPEHHDQTRMGSHDTIAADLKNFTDLLRSQEQQLDRLSQLVTQLQNQARQIPPVPKLVQAEDFHSWRDDLTQMLDHYGLTKYIRDDIPEPQDNVRARCEWLKNRLDVDDYIQAAVPDPELWNTFRGLGWSAKDSNPKKSFDFIVQHFEKAHGDNCVSRHRELVNARRRDFDNPASSQAHQTGGEEASAPSAHDRRDPDILLNNALKVRSEWLELMFPAGSEDLVAEYCTELNRKRSIGQITDAYVLKAPCPPKTKRRIMIPPFRHFKVLQHDAFGFVLTFESKEAAARFKRYALLFECPPNDTSDGKTLILPAKPQAYFREKLSSRGSKVVHYKWFMWSELRGIKRWCQQGMCTTGEVGA